LGRERQIFGDFMDHSIGSKLDPQVTFVPDAWQHEVLDCLDRNDSILVVGKYLFRELPLYLSHGHL
jgi:superfamily II RNA helicase